MRLPNLLKSWKTTTIACALLLGVGAALALAYLCFLHQPSQRQRETNSSQGQAQPPLSFLSSGAVGAFCGLLAQAKPGAETNKEKSGPEAPDWTDKAQAYSAVAVTFLTLVLIVITVRQFGLLARSTRAAENAAESASDAVVTAVESVKIAERTLIASQRPWLKVDCAIAAPLSFEAKGVKTVLEFRIKNIGNMPAFSVFPSTTCLVRNSSKYDRFAEQMKISTIPSFFPCLASAEFRSTC